MAKVPIKKKDVADLISASMSEKMDILNKFKQVNGIDNVKKKEQQWICLGKAFEEPTSIVGIPRNTVSCCKGHTNTGKSSLLYCLIAEEQRQGKLPVFFDLENSVKWNHARDIGVEVSETIDEATGEVILGPGENMLYFDSHVLYDKYKTYDHSQSKYTQKPTRDTYVIEDVALCIREIIKQQRLDELPFDMTFFIDSIGCSDCYKAAVSSASNAMWYAAAVSQCFMTIVNDLIPSTMNVNSKYNNTLFYINKIWVEKTPGGLPMAQTRGGNSLQYVTRLSIFLGGQGGPSIKKHYFSYKGVDYAFASTVKIRIDKNHVSDIERSGEIAFTKYGSCAISDLEEYKVKYKKYLVETLKAKTGEDVSEKDLKESEIIVDE